jgi:hypothetical protein
MTSKQGKVNHVKVLFEFENADGVMEIESAWAVPVDNGYQIDNVLFYAKELAHNDIVSAEPDEGGMLRFTGLVSASGHSTVRLWFANESDVAQVRDALRGMGCTSELDLPRLVAIDIPPSVQYEQVRTYLSQQESAGILEYEEACLAQN